MNLGLIEAPEKSSYENHLAGFRAFFVEKTGNNIEFIEEPERYSNKYPPRTQCKGIEYHGTNRGEWGGKLTATSKDGNTRVILDGSNTYHLVPWYDSLYVFTGTQHMGSGGAVYFIGDCANKESKIEYLTALPDAPISIEIRDRPDMAEFFVFGNNSILHLFPNSRTIEILAFKPWKGIAPTNSVMLDNSRVLVGLQSGVALVRLRGIHTEVRVFIPADKVSR
jgi:hypothetical protein